LVAEFAELADHSGGACLPRLFGNRWTVFLVTDSLVQDQPDQPTLSMGKQALARVKANKGSPGVDGMTVHDLPGFLKQHWPTIRDQLMNGTYVPQLVRRVEIAKPDGGVRKLGIPTVIS
jgi:hypothetical protein